MTVALRDQCIAFAAVCQAASLVNRSAHGLATNSREVDPLIKSIFATQPDTIEDVFGSVTNLRCGATAAQDLLSPPTAELAPVLKYVMVLLDIEARLRRRSDIAHALREGIESLQRLENDESLYAQISALYQRTISTLDRRVHVTGSPEFLQRPEIAAKIRVLLLAGIRSAWLWHQSGGRRWHLLLRRSTMRNTLKTLVPGSTD
jgi:high frequency lysogenization protein